MKTDESRKGQTAIIGGDKYLVCYEWEAEDGQVGFMMRKKKPHGLTNDQKNRALRIVAVLRVKGPISASAIARQLRSIEDRFAYDDIVRNLCKRMVEHGILFRTGAGSTTRWHLVEGWTDEKIDNHLAEKRQPKHCVECGDELKMTAGQQLEFNAGKWVCMTCIVERLSR